MKHSKNCITNVTLRLDPPIPYCNEKYNVLDHYWDILKKKGFLPLEMSNTFKNFQNPWILNTTLKSGKFCQQDQPRFFITRTLTNSITLVATIRSHQTPCRQDLEDSFQ